MKIFIDIETIAAQSDNAIELLKSNIKQAKERLSPPGNYGAEAAEKWVSKRAKELDDGYKQAHLKTSFDGGLGEIITIAFKIEDGDIMSVSRLRFGTIISEKEMLIDFFDILSHQLTLKGGTIPKVIFVGHNLIKFDLPFIYKRCVINNVNPCIDIPIGAKHGYNAFDTMLAWAGYGGRISQDNLCKTLGLQTKQGMDGSKVYQAWLDGKHDEITKYCRSDVSTVVDMYNRLTFKTRE